MHIQKQVWSFSVILWQSTSFLISKHSAVTSTFLTALTWSAVTSTFPTALTRTVGYHLRSLFSQICSKILQDWIFTHIHLCWDNQICMEEEKFQSDSNESRNTGARWYPHHWKQCQLHGTATRPGTSSQEKALDHQRQGCPRGHQETVFHNGFGIWDNKQHFWGQLRAMSIPTVLEANSGKQLSLQRRLRRSWGLAKFRMTGTPKEKRENTSKEIVWNMHFLFLWQTWLVASIQKQLCRGWSINNAKPRKEISKLIYSTAHAVLNNVVPQLSPSP